MVRTDCFSVFFRPNMVKGFSVKAFETEDFQQAKYVCEEDFIRIVKDDNDIGFVDYTMAPFDILRMVEGFKNLSEDETEDIRWQFMRLVNPSALKKSLKKAFLNDIGIKIEPMKNMHNLYIATIQVTYDREIK